jgi:hypothetical protein
MTFEPRVLFANLAEKERINGHHSPEGRAIRTFSRALDGWAAGNLAAVDVLALCEQGMEDWLKTRLKIQSWSARGLADLLPQAIEKNLLTGLDGDGLWKLNTIRLRLVNNAEASDRDAEAALELCIRIVEKHW